MKFACILKLYEYNTPFLFLGLEYSREELEKSKWKRIKNVFWNVMDKPGSSRLARVSV